MGLYLAISLLLLGLLLTLIFMVWLRGGIKSRDDLIGTFKISLKVFGGAHRRAFFHPSHCRNFRPSIGVSRALHSIKPERLTRGLVKRHI
jgi:hypothetical protein